MKTNYGSFFPLILGAGVATTLFVAMETRGAVGVGPSFKGPIGLQLYSLRAQCQVGLPATLDEVKGWGVKYLELAGTYGVPPEAFKAKLKERGLEAVSGHFPFERYRDDVEGVAADAKALGLQYTGCAWIPHTDPFDEKTCREAIAVFNKAGKALAKHGLKFFYHVHGYEFQPYGQGTLLDLMMAETNPKYVNYQMDIFWIVFPGQDPVKLLEKYGKRWQLMHLKDMRKGTQTGALTGHTDVTNDATLGTGLMDIPAILKAAKKAGIKWYFIEDESPWSEKQVPLSLRYLEQVKW